MADELLLTSHGDGILITSQPLDEVEPLRFVRHAGAGATCLFVGTTRDSFRGQKVLRLEYEAYLSLALKTLSSILSRCRSSFPVSLDAHSSTEASPIIRLYVSHRLGVVGVEEPSICVAASSPHRKLAFEACEWVLERVKEEAQIWKKEVYADGGMKEGEEARGTWKENFPGGKVPGSEG